MRNVLIAVLACALSLVVTASGARPPRQPLPGVHLRGQVLAPLVPQSPDLDRELAGLPRTSRPEVLTWERAYALACVRARAGRGAVAETLDPAALTKEAARHGFADFARFRKDFLAGHPGAVETFRDPSADVLDLLRRLQAIDNARRNVAVLENITKQLQELIQGGSSGLSRLDFDLAFASLVEARQAMSDEVRQFRDQLDQVKVSLGLSPHAAVVPDRESIAAFPATFDAVESWSRQPDRILSDLPALVERLPALGDVVVDGQPILDGLAHDRDQPEEVLAGAVRLAIKNRGVLGQGQAPADAGPELELRVRRAIRDLVEDRRAYESQKRIYEMGIRLQDQAFERMIAPGAGVISARSPLLVGLIEHVTQVWKTEDRLVALWTSFQAKRLSLYRDLGILPHQDWHAFFLGLSARREVAGAVPEAAPAAAAQPPVPAPQPPTLPVTTPPGGREPDKP